MSRNWLKIENPQTHEASIFDLDLVKGCAKTKGRITIYLKDGGDIVFRGKERRLGTIWKQIQAHTIGVPIGSYWDLRRKAK